MSVVVDQQIVQQVVQQIEAGENEARRAFLPPHIVVLVHGNNGAPSDFDAVEAALLRKFGRSQVLVIKSAMNHTQTSMGVEVGGTKLAEEVYQEVFKYELHPDIDVYKLSMISHSLGGLYSRFAIVQLIDLLSPLNIQYVSFVTICTPHLGSRRPRGDSKLKVCVYLYAGLSHLTTCVDSTDVVVTWVSGLFSLPYDCRTCGGWAFTRCSRPARSTARPASICSLKARNQPSKAIKTTRR